MRKTSLLLLVAVATVGNTGCTSCCGKIRSMFHRGAPCGTTTVAPAALGTPLVMSAPAASSPPVVRAPQVFQQAPQMVQQAPQVYQQAPQVICCPQQQAPVCMPCQESCCPCDSGCGECNSCGQYGGGWMSGSSGYFSSGGTGCSECNGGMVSSPGVVYDGGYQGEIYEGETYSGGVRSSAEPTPASQDSDAARGRYNDPAPRP